MKQNVAEFMCLQKKIKFQEEIIYNEVKMVENVCSFQEVKQII